MADSRVLDLGFVLDFDIRISEEHASCPPLEGRLQAPSSLVIWIWDFFGILSFGHWDFFGILSFGFGIFHLGRPQMEIVHHAGLY